MNEFFKKYWKSYELFWCDLCGCASIVCPSCKSGSCSCGGCEKCISDVKEFDTCKNSLRDYLTPAEQETSEKIWQLKKHILNSLELGEKEIDFQKLKETGGLSQNEEQLYFKDFLDPNS